MCWTGKQSYDNNEISRIIKLCDQPVVAYTRIHNLHNT